MKRKTSSLISTFIFLIGLCMFFFIPEKSLFAETDLDDIQDGAYSIDYVILHAETESVSIANDYFEKPATLFVENGEKYIQFPLNHSQWTKELQAPLGDDFVHVDVISTNEEEDTRVVEFKLDRDLTEPLEFKMHVLIETMDPVYDNRYTVRFDFDIESLEQLENVERRISEGDDTIESMADNEDEIKEDNGDRNQVLTADHENSDKSSNSLFLWLIAGTSLLILFGIFGYFIRKNKKSEENME